MLLINPNDISQAFRLQKYGKIGHFVSMVAMNTLKFNDINGIYNKYDNLNGLEFIDAVLSELNIVVDVSENDLQRLPKNAPFVMVANHPLGGIDGLILLKILLEHSPNSKIMANFLLKKIKPIEEFVYAVNPFESLKEVSSSYTGIRQVLEHLRNGHPIGIFPAGEVTKMDMNTRKLKECEWKDSILKLLKKTNAPIIPVYFHARNSPFFYFVAGISDNFKTLALPSEVIRGRNKSVKVRIGKAIEAKQKDQCRDINDLRDLLKNRLYLLSNCYAPTRQQKSQKLDKTESVPLLNLDYSDKVREIMNSESMKQRLLFEKGQYSLFLTKTNDYPILGIEIGRLREKTFREVGEGTNRAIDIDKYDSYYYQLLLWDKSEQKIVGGYRLGFGNEIYAQKNIDGFYLSESFYFSSTKMQHLLQNCIEMGRAFIVASHQQKPLPLFLLWQGIIQIGTQHPNCQYLIGSASVSNCFSDYSKSMMVEFFKRHFMDKTLSNGIVARNRFKTTLSAHDYTILSQIDADNIQALDKIIEEIEPQKQRIPVLIKKYLHQNARILGFNIDPAFSNALDVLMCIDVNNIKMNNESPQKEPLTNHRADSLAHNHF